MAKAKSEALVKRATATALQPYEEEMAREARDEKSKETLGVPRITHRGGVLKIDGKAVAGNKVKLAVVDYIFEKAYYPNPFDPDTPTTPDCYAFAKSSDGEKSMVAHSQAPHKQNLQPDGTSPCTGCKWNAFNTADVGRGKKCKDNRRLLVISPVLDAQGTPKIDPQGVAKAEVRQISIPPASLKAWGNYLASLQDSTRTGNVREMIVEIGTAPTDRGGHALTFDGVKALDGEAVKALMARRAASEGLLTQPYPVLETEEKPAPVKRSAKSNKKLD